MRVSLKVRHSWRSRHIALQIPGRGLEAQPPRLNFPGSQAICPRIVKGQNPLFQNGSADYIKAHILLSVLAPAIQIDRQPVRGGSMEQRAQLLQQLAAAAGGAGQRLDRPATAAPARPGSSGCGPAQSHPSAGCPRLAPARLRWHARLTQGLHVAIDGAHRYLQPARQLRRSHAFPAHQLINNLKQAGLDFKVLRLLSILALYHG